MSEEPDTEETPRIMLAEEDEELVLLDVEKVRFSGENAASDALRAEPWARDLVVAADARGRADSSRSRRQLMARGGRLTAGIAPDLWESAADAASALGIRRPFEIHQADPTPNPALHLVEEPILIEVRSRLVALLDTPSTTALVGQQFGNYLALGPGSRNGALGLVVRTTLEEPTAPERARRAASTLAMARAITSDRFGLLACRDLSAALRLEMAATTGLPADTLTWDTSAYLEQCKALVEQARQPGEEEASFPEHGLRAWALWLFSETDTYQEWTGLGTGNRTVREIDEMIAEVLGASPPDGLVDTAVVLEPLPEVHECALASAALVALSDGDLSEEEMLTVERVFAPLVGDWERILVWDNALEVFADTSSAVINGGPSVQRSVFQVLVQVLAADAEVEAREIEMVCAIGDALQAGELFRAMLAPVLKAFGEEPRDLSQIREVIPMPARASEAETALRVFLEGVARRGGGELTLRRLYRLLGDRDGTAASQAIVKRVMGEVELSTPVILSETLPDQPVPVVLTDDAARQRYEDANTLPRWKIPEDAPNARHRLARGLSRLRESLVSGDGRSPAVRLRACRTGRAFDLHSLESMSVGHGERVLTLVANGQPARVVDGREVGVHEVAEKVSRELLALQREAVARHEQTGARDLYVGTPFLRGLIDGYLVRGPLVLYPYELERSETRSFQLVPREGDPRIVNQALLRLLFSKKGLAFPEELGEKLDLAADESVEAVRRVLADEGLRFRDEGDELVGFDAIEDEGAEADTEGRIVLESCAVLGFFPQSTSDMIQDYDGLLTAVADSRVPLADKLGAAGPLLPVELREDLAVSEAWDGGDDKAPIVPVVPTDPSQRRVLDRARTQRLLVVDGPPGTGKSQVIVNLVADALSRGQSVAVVCEKRAALDVVAQRLDTLGLRHLLAVVHDVHDDRRALYNQIVERLKEDHVHRFDDVSAERVADDLGAVTAQLEERRTALMRALGEDRPSLGQLHLLASSFDGEPLRNLDPELVQLAPRSLQRLAERIGRESHHADLHEPGSIWRAPPGAAPRPSLADANEDQRARVQDVLRSSRSSARAVSVLEKKQGVSAEKVMPASQAIRAALNTRSGRQDRARRDLWAAWLARGDDPGLQSLVERLEGAWETVSDWQDAAPGQAPFEITPDVTEALAVARTWGSSFWRYFSMAWWRARTTIRHLLGAQWPAAAAAPVNEQLVNRIEQRRAGSVAWSSLQSLLQVLDIDPVLPDTGAATVWVERILETYRASRPVLESETTLRAAAAWPETSRATSLDAWDEMLEDRLALIEAGRQHSEAFAPARTWFPWQPEGPAEEVVAALHEAWAVDAPRVVTSDHNLTLAAELYRGARSLVQTLAERVGQADASVWADALEHGWSVAGIDQVERRHPGTRVLDRISPSDLELAEQQLGELVERRGELHVQRILQYHDKVPLLTEARPEQGRSKTPLQKSREQMLRESSKRRYILSLRSFVRQFFEQGLMELLPVWLVSPETIAVLFPGRPVFDLVVMDEASQCTVEKGLPALMRGHRAVVAGDDKQMPPTSFFEIRAANEEEEVGTEDTIEADALTAESLLVLARERCVHEGLRWHYRCLREELIAFSNHAMYGGDLYTIPSIATGRALPALRWEAVENAKYDHGANRREATRVVDILDELLQESPPPSVGVVTFNIQQRQMILDKVDSRCEKDADFGRRFAIADGHPELDQRPFVKNLEAVQGDERDVIIFSLGHAPVIRKNGESHVPARFGPLGQAGGERRLNVAVSRAKRECIVVCSFEPAMLSVADTKHAGPKLLKSFLQYAWDLTHGRRLQAEKILERVRHGSLGEVPPRMMRAELEVPSLAVQIAERLDQEGVDYDLDVGTSGFRIPLAVVDPENPTAYRVAVIGDIGAGSEDIEEIHLHEPRVLQARGWKVVRVDSRRWHRDPNGVVNRVLEAIGIR